MYHTYSNILFVKHNYNGLKNITKLIELYIFKFNSRFFIFFMYISLSAQVPFSCLCHVSYDNLRHQDDIISRRSLERRRQI